MTREGGRREEPDPAAGPWEPGVIRVSERERHVGDLVGVPHPIESARRVEGAGLGVEAGRQFREQGENVLGDGLVGEAAVAVSGRCAETRAECKDRADRVRRIEGNRHPVVAALQLAPAPDPTSPEPPALRLASRSSRTRRYLAGGVGGEGPLGAGVRVRSVARADRVAGELDERLRRDEVLQTREERLRRGVANVRVIDH